jgi:hypothetical protein
MHLQVRSILSLNNIWSVLLIEETIVPVVSHFDLPQILLNFIYHINLYQVHLANGGNQTHDLSGDNVNGHVTSLWQLTITLMRTFLECCCNLILTFLHL